MKLVNNIYILLFSLLIVGQSYGQAPGLTGKRYSIFYQNVMAGNTLGTAFNQAERTPISNPGTYITLGEDPSQVMNMQHLIQLDYATGRARSFGVALGYFRNGYGVFEENGFELLSKNFVARSLSLHWKRFNVNRGGIAPLGVYREYSFYWYNISDYWSENSEYFSTPTRINEQTYNLTTFAVNWGRQTIIAKEYLFNMGVEMGMVIPLRTGENFGTTYGDFFSLEANSVAQRMALFQFFRLKIGVGLAAF